LPAATVDSAFPILSVVVPSYRQGRFLRPCLESLLRQSGPALEILVLDNCSDDETAAVLEAYRTRLSRVEVRPDHGQADALRRGFAMARGEILAWLNCDDMLMPAAAARAVNVLQADPAIDVVYGHCAHIDEAGDFLGYFHFISDYDEEILRNASDFIPQPSTFFRRSAYERSGGLDPSLSYTMDWDLWCLMARSGAKFRFLPEVLAAARIHAGAKTVRGGLRRFLEVTRVNLRHKTRPLPTLATHFLAHQVAGRLRLKSLGPLYSALLRLRGSLGGLSIQQSVVLGIGHGPKLLARSADVRFPVFREVSAFRVQFDRPEARADVRICGEVAVRSGSSYCRQFESARFIEDVRVEVEGYEGVLPASIAVQVV
jgi:glycosyltransferase involved in cell wall biosynthesis